MTAAEHAIGVEGLVLGYGRTRVLRGADLRLPPTATTILLGRNGAGKTTLLRALVGLLAPTGGRIRVLGLDPTRDRSRVCEQVGYVPEHPDVWPSMRVRETARICGAHQPRWDDARFDRMIRRFGVDPAKRFGALSKGEGTKAMIALALATDPALLLMDEPFGGLDPVARGEVLDEVIDTLAERPRTVFVSTHETEVAARIGEYLVVLADGRISAPRRMEEVLHAKDGPRGAAALGALLLEAARADSGRVRSAEEVAQ